MQCPNSGDKIIKEKCKINMLNMDCMEFMKNIENKYFDLCICDPPYGIGQDWKKRNKGQKYNKDYKNCSIPSKKYFEELFRISKNQIIWGYNYFVKYLGATNYLIIWDKQSKNNKVFKYSKAEIGYTSKKVPCNLVSIPWDGYRMGKETGQKKIHPHQKPIALYKWLLQNYAEPGYKIFDSHGGSGSICIAC
ncbi:MAG: DNA methyltransferase [Candidatus Thorarchaeota archaeon]